MTTRNRLLLALCCIVSAFVLAIPVKRRTGHYFVFWKTASQELLPNIEHLQRKTRHLILHYFQEDLVNRTAGSVHTMDSAKILYERLNLTKFPSQRVLERENRTLFIFIKGLMKENYRLCDTYTRILSEERKFRCANDSNLLSLCDKTKELESGLRDVTLAIKEQLEQFFLAKTETAAVSKRQRKMRAYFNKRRQTDETEMSRVLPKSEDGESSELETSRLYHYKRRNRATVGLLYAVFIHLQDTEGTLQYALRLLEPPRDL